MTTSTPIVFWAVVGRDDDEIHSIHRSHAGALKALKPGTKLERWITEALQSRRPR